MSDSDDRLRATALALTDGIGWKLINRLLDYFGSLENILTASPDELQSVRGIGKQISRRIAQIDLAHTAADLARFEAEGVHMATWNEAQYPLLLRSLEDKPLVIFWRGNLRADEEHAIAIVGAREPGDLSESVAVGWAGAIATRGWAVVSGLARGIDTLAHRGALAVGGRTIAVLGCGVNRVYPPENRALAHQIAASGVLLSESHPDSGVGRDTLVYRNRLITALSQATIVIEAGETSGALHAARRAHEQGRVVFVRPGSIGNDALLASFAVPLPDDPQQIDEVLKQI